MLKRFNRLLALAAALFTGFGLNAELPAGQEPPRRTAAPTVGGDQTAVVERALRRRALANARQAAAERARPAREAAKAARTPSQASVKGKAPINGMAAPKAGFTPTPGVAALPGVLNPLGTPDYMGGVVPNYANSPLIRKFVDTLPGLGAANANNLGSFIPVAVADTTTFPGSDFYDLAVVNYTHQFSQNLPLTRVRGYKDRNGDNQAHYLGPLIIAQRDRAVRVKFTNELTGNLLIPMDSSLMGSGSGPGGTAFSQNRAELHLHGGLSPWISDGTPHQWITPAGDTSTGPKKGVSFRNVPDMGSVIPGGYPGTAGDGVGTYFWTNQQSGRLMFYHDHSFGLTRLNVYSGEAAGYLIVDPVETKLISDGILPDNGGGVYNYGIPLIVQDKTFVPSLADLTNQDPTWDTTNWGQMGDLWYPHVYMPNQNPGDPSGANAMGRWDYGPWFWPPVPVATDPAAPTPANTIPYAHRPVPGALPGAPESPGTPNPSLTPESFMDTPVINGTAYPKMTVEPKAYRFRILNAANDRPFGFAFYTADPAAPTEVVMIPATPAESDAGPKDAAGLPLWPRDGRDGGVVDWRTAGPDIIQIGTESGFLPTPVVLKSQATTYNYNRRDIVVLDVANHPLFLGPAERADVIVDFSAFAGKTLILYNDMLAPVPAFDVRYDYFTGAPDQTATGGVLPTLPGFGPNTRTLMQIQVANTAPAAPFNLAALNAAFTSTATSNGVFAATQHPPIVPQTFYNAAMNTAVTKDTYATIQAYELKYNSTEDGSAITMPLQPKAIQELFELDYGRMNATLGIELPFTNFNNQTTIPLGFSEPSTEILTDGTTQLWKITHNGVDTHPVHFHLYDVQIVNRVGWDGAVRFPEANELGWKETVKMKPLEDIIVAFRPISPRLPFTLGNSVRSIDPTKDANAQVSVTDLTNILVNQGNLGNQILVSNSNGINGNAGLGYDYGWEYVWHCHILGHEENDFMRPVVLNVATTTPAASSLLFAVVQAATPNRADLTWTDNATNETGFSIQRRASGTAAAFVQIGTTVPYNGYATPNVRTYSDFTIAPGAAYDYQVVAYNQAGESLPTPFATIGAQPTVMSGLVYSVVAGSNVPLPGALITFTGTSPNATVPLPASTTATTDATGAYVVSLPYNWTGTVTPALAAFAFTPATLSFAALTTNLTAQNFVARPVVTISGTVSVGALPLAGVTVTLSNGGGFAVTDAAGAYAVTVGSGYTGTATPALAGYIFAPASTSYANVMVNQAAQNYAATAVVAIAGTIANGATPIASVTVSFSTGQTLLTDAFGNYSLTLPSPYSGTVTPSKANFTFVPVSRTYTAVTTDQAVQNYAATAVVTISGAVTSGVAPLAGVTLTFSTGQTVVTGAGGLYSLTVSAPYTGTVTPSLAGFIFNPVSRSFTAISVDQTAQNFAAQVVLSGTGTYNALPLAGVTMTYTGGSTLTAADGTYAITLTLGWSGTVTPSKTGYLFTAPSTAYLNLGTSTPNQNYTAVAGIEIAGQVYINSVPIQPLRGVTMTFSNGGGSVVTDANGFYTQFVPSGWSGTATPALVGFVFTPAVRNYTNITTLQTGRNYVAGAVVTYSGNVSSNVTPLAGVRVAFSNGGGAVNTDASGNYTITLNSGWTGTITPTLRGYIFAPAAVVIAAPVTVNSTQNFNTIQTIAGRARILVNGQNVGLQGVTITLSTGGTAITDVNGNFTFQVPTGWTGTLSASDGGVHTWTPVNFTYTNLVTNVSGLRFNGL